MFFFRMTLVHFSFNSSASAVSFHLRYLDPIVLSITETNQSLTCSDNAEMAKTSIRYFVLQNSTTKFCTTKSLLQHVIDRQRNAKE